MKAKYEKMIDEYVKKHYGDLERGVLAPEVKYKVLFKIYRKKYKKARETAKVLSDVVYSWHIKNDSEGNLPCSDCEHYVPMHPEGLDVIPASCQIGRDMAPCCPFYSVKVDVKKAQKEMFDLREVCGNCVHFREGKGEDKSICAKHDKFVTETCSCFEWEKKNCTLCKHSRMLSALNYEGAYTSCLWCDKKNEKRSALDEVCEDFE